MAFLPALGRSLAAALVVAAGLCLIRPAPAAATNVLAGPLSAADFQALNGSGASYYGAWPLGFGEGPLVVDSGQQAILYAADGVAQIDAFVIALSISAADAAFAGSIVLEVETAGGAGVGSVHFLASDFVSFADSDFPNTLPGMGNALVNGISFPNRYAQANRVAGAFADLDALASAAPGDALARIAVTTPVDLRVDLLGLSGGGVVYVIEATSVNREALGVRADGSAAVPEPRGALAFALGLLVLAPRLRRSRPGPDQEPTRDPAAPTARRLRRGAATRS
jgi:hypothetical protein